MIVGEKVRLRAFEEDDAELLWQWDNDWEAGRWLINRYPSPLSEAREAAQKTRTPNPNTKSFAVEAHDAGLIGWCALCRISWEDRRASLAVFIGDKARWGQGYGADATWTLVRFGFEEMNLNRIGLDVHADNARAIRCYEKLGFVHEGVQRQADYRDGAYVDLIIMSILRDEFMRASAA
jgi:RimJ/RimL family protein N-acetyltransferase